MSAGSTKSIFVDCDPKSTAHDESSRTRSSRAFSALNPASLTSGSSSPARRWTTPSPAWIGAASFGWGAPAYAGSSY